MLKKFLYLDTDSVSSYISAVEGGLRTSTSTRTTDRGTTDGQIDAKLLKGGKAVSHESEETFALSDEPIARFERLIAAAQSNPAGFSWYEATDDIDDVFGGLRNGDFLAVNVDLSVPPISRALSQNGGLAELVDGLEALRPFASVFGNSDDELPGSEMMAGIKTAAQSFGTDLSFVGEPDSDSWSICGRLKSSFLLEEIEDNATVIGKVSKIWGSGMWKPLVALPGSTFISRAERRKLERQGPNPGQEENFLQGPALMLDVLAIYR
ncbi:DUF6414 family protein [Glutamicibacter arilaitensis]|uniref:DUF6414 family protein n=1 Tax=Glutamicibacter arilaitensis TaxID=256701 RepID=UPI003F9031C2